MTSSIECKNFLRSLQLLNLLIKIGVQNLIFCPGSRSAPLAIAAGELNKLGLVNIYNSIDERSAGFHSLGISAASGNLSLVITTCLLYTSPSPRDISGSRMPSSA